MRLILVMLFLFSSAYSIPQVPHISIQFKDNKNSFEYILRSKGAKRELVSFQNMVVKKRLILDRKDFIQLRRRAKSYLRFKEKRYQNCSASEAIVLLNIDGQILNICNKEKFDSQLLGLMKAFESKIKNRIKD